MEADDVGPELMYGLHREMRCWTVEHCHFSMVSDWRVRSDDAVPNRIAGVYAISKLCFLKDSQVHVRQWLLISKVDNVVIELWLDGQD